MILNTTKPIFKSSEDLQEHFFSIEDQGMIFDILRSKMYSNPILAIAREVASNGRDAMREISQSDKPIVIHLPSGLEPEYKVKDFGPGISPDRMLNIFIKYTASTKRNNNVQGGGFGVGAKVPFSYTSSFVVITIHDGIKYNYTCGIDETRVGKLVLLDKTNTDEPNGTEIVIPVKSSDFTLFKQYTEQACRHWDPKPIITNGKIEWKTFIKTVAGKSWVIATNNGDYYDQGNVKLIIDGIEYPLDTVALSKYADLKLLNSINGVLMMYFGVGELSLSASREQIYLDKPTQDKIKNRLDDITKEIKILVEDKILVFPNLWDANLYYRKELTSAFNNLQFLGPLTWKGIVLNNNYMDLKCDVYTFSRGKYSRKNGTDPNKLTRSLGHLLRFVEGSEVYINDLPLKDPTPKHLKKAFEDNLKLNNVQVICPNSAQSEDDLNKKYHLDQMFPKRLSSITKVSSRKNTPSAARLLIFQFTESNIFQQVSYEAMEEDSNDKVLCLLARDAKAYSNYERRSPILSTTGSPLKHDIMRSIKNRFPKISFYGIDQDTDKNRIEKEFSDFERLDTFIDKNLLNNKSIDYVAIRHAQLHRHMVDHNLLDNFDNLEKLILDDKSLLITVFDLHQKIKNMNDADSSLLDIYETVNGKITDAELINFKKKNPTWDIAKINIEFDKKYPLMGYITFYDPGIYQHVAQYINLMDKI